MRTRSEALAAKRASESPSPPDLPKADIPKEVVLQHDLINEQVVLAAGLLDSKLAIRLQPDHFLAPVHKAAWSVVQEMHRRKLEFDPATFQTLCGASVDVPYVLSLAEARPDIPANLEHHVEMLLWDKARHTCTTGPVAQLLEAIRDPRENPEKVKSLARSVSTSLDGYKDRSFLRDGKSLVLQQMDDLRERRAGRRSYEFGLKGLDFFEEHPGVPPQRRIIPGPAPKMVTVVAGVPGSGKSTLVANLVSAAVDQKKRVLCGAWEMTGGITCELVAAIRQDISRADLQLGAITDEEQERLEAEMMEVVKYVHFLDNPFHRRTKERSNNERNLDLLQGYISDVGPDLVVLDLWRRMLRKFDPEEEELALIRQQAMAEETNTHHILVQQLRAKDLEARADKRPTRESIKGSGAWIEVPDLILCPHRPALFKRVEDTKMEICILKQRYGKWPLMVEMDWNPEKGKISGGKSVPYDVEAGGETSNEIDGMVDPKSRNGGGKKSGYFRGKRYTS